MLDFDVSKPWSILLPAGIPAAEKSGAELSRCIDLLRRRINLILAPPALEDGSNISPDDSAPIIVLNIQSDQGDRNGFSWRMGDDRLEIFGDSSRGLCNGVFNFLAALGFRWPAPDREELPAMDKGHPLNYPLAEAKAYRASNTDLAARRRLVLSREDLVKKQEPWIVWAARNQIDALVFPLRDGRKGIFSAGQQKRIQHNLAALGFQYAMGIEWGGWDLTCLTPNRRGEMFRMEEGRRNKDYNFCATNPDTIKLIRKEAERVFREHPNGEVFHLWPDRGHERTWCSCPTCRAFSPEEQNRIAVNAAADALASVKPQARLSYYEGGDDPVEIAIRPNMFKLKRLPGETNAEGEGLFCPFEQNR